jgi:hypothetical protein
MGEWVGSVADAAAVPPLSSTHTSSPRPQLYRFPGEHGVRMTRPPANQVGRWMVVQFPATTILVNDKEVKPDSGDPALQDERMQ